MVVECLQVLGPKASTHLACKVVLVVVGVVVDVADKVEAVIEVEDVVDENVVDSVVDVVVEGASGRERKHPQEKPAFLIFFEPPCLQDVCAFLLQHAAASGTVDLWDQQPCKDNDETQEFYHVSACRLCLNPWQPAECFKNNAE